MAQRHKETQSREQFISSPDPKPKSDPERRRNRKEERHEEGGQALVGGLHNAAAERDPLKELVEAERNEQAGNGALAAVRAEAHAHQDGMHNDADLKDLKRRGEGSVSLSTTDSDKAAKIKMHSFDMRSRTEEIYKVNDRLDCTASKQ